MAAVTLPGASSTGRFAPARSRICRGAEGHVKRVTGIGCIIFKAKDAPTLHAWYKRHLGIDVQSWGGAAFDWSGSGTTAFLIAPENTKQFAPSQASFMV